MSSSKTYLLATVFIAINLGFIPGRAQNLSESTANAVNPSNPSNPSPEQQKQQRTRIAAERRQAHADFDAQKKACYQQLAVTPCINQARDAHNTKIADLKRQEVVLNDGLRKSRAAKRQAELDARNSPEAQLRQAQQRGRIIEQQSNREQNRKPPDAAESGASQPGAASTGIDAAQIEPKRSTSAPPKPQGQARTSSETTRLPSQALSAQQRAENLAASARREQQAQERRAKAEQRLKDKQAKNKKAAQPLPVMQ
jgi:colicin import membrane protein